MTQLCSEDRCTGCAACYNACPSSAIVMCENQWGEQVPRIEHEACIECNRCVRACPVLNDVPRWVPGECYAAWAKDPADRAESSSGGVAHLLTRHVINEGGVVFGAAFDSGLTVRHCAAVDLAESLKFRKSKYVQSDIGRTYSVILSHLRSGRTVLMTGTPCQVAGLKGFLGSEYANLLTVDLICHGTPPARYLQEHVRTVAGRNDAVSEVRFRDEGYRLIMNCQERMLYSRPWHRDLYYYAFMKGLSLRESCYQCSYADSFRCSDLTVGDFWGIDRESLVRKHEGRISLVLVNTSRGSNLLQTLGAELYVEERSLAEAVAGNPQLRRPSTRHPLRSRFRAAYPAAGFVGAMRMAGVTREVSMVAVKEAPPYRWIRSAKQRIIQAGPIGWLTRKRR